MGTNIRPNRIAEVVPLWRRVSAAEFIRAKREAIEDPWKFIDVINFHGGTSMFEDIHKELIDFLLSTPDRKLVLMPRGHLKSTICSTLLVLWMIYRDPNVRIIVCSAREELASAFIRELMQYLEDPTLQEMVWNKRPHIHGNLVPEMNRGKGNRKSRAAQDYADTGESTEALDKKVVWKATAIQVLRDRTYKEATVRAVSVKMRITGEHYDMAVYDDIVDYENSDNRRKAEKILSWARDIESVLNTNPQVKLPLGQLYLLGTRYFSWDYYGHLFGEDIDDEKDLETFRREFCIDPVHKFERNIYRNGVDANDGYLCPSLFSSQLEEKYKRRLGNKRFCSQYLNKILADGDIRFRHDDLRFLSRDSYYIANGILYVLSKDEREPPTPVMLSLVVDPAASLKDSADYTAISAGGKDKDGNLYVVACRYGHWTPTQIIDNTYELCRELGIRRVVVEVVAFQLALINIFKSYFIKPEYFALHLVEFRPKGEKKTRIETNLQPHLEARTLLCTYQLAPNPELRRELEFFPNERDDLLDTLAVLNETSTNTKNVQDRNRRSTPQKRRERVNSKYGGYR